MAYQVRIAKSATREIRSLDPQVKERIKVKLRWLGDNAEKVIHHRLSGLVLNQKEVFRLRVGDWRVFYLLSHENKEIQVLTVIHRSEAYRRLP